MANIDSQINDRMQMYAGNPQGLMQRYAQTQELVDLLALQKMKNDRAAATSAVQGAMQPPPGTVKGQLEQEAMQGARNDVMRSMAPGIQQRGRQMAQMQNRAAMGLPTQAAPNMARMAMGGIVGYQEGGDVGSKGMQPPAVSNQNQRRAPYLDPALEKFLVELEALNKQKDAAFPQEKDLFEQKIQDLINTTSPRVKRLASESSFGLPKKSGMAMGGQVKRYQEGAMVESDESRFGVTTDSGLSRAEAVAMDMQGPEAQQPKLGDELGSQIESGASWLVDYVKENPLEAASYGLMFVPGLNLVRGGIAAMRAAPAIVNAATKVGRTAQKLYTRPRMSGYGSMVRGPKGKFMSAKDAQAAGLRLNRQFSPMRAAGSAGIAANIASQLMDGEEAAEPVQGSGITAGMAADPTNRQKLGSMVGRPSAVFKDNMADREKGGLDIDFRALREFLTSGGGQTSVAGALGAGARGLGAFQAAEQAREDKKAQIAEELAVRRDQIAATKAVAEARALAALDEEQREAVGKFLTLPATQTRMMEIQEQLGVESLYDPRVLAALQPEITAYLKARTGGVGGMGGLESMSGISEADQALIDQYSPST